MMPLLKNTVMTSFTLPADAVGGKPTQTRQMTYVVTPGYAEAVGLRLHQGRFFTDGDASAGTRAMIVNEEFVRRYLSDGLVVGRRFGRLYPNDANVVTEIVGVVGNVLKDGNDRQPEPEIYFAHNGSPTRRIAGTISIIVRTTGDPAAIASTLRAIVRDVDRTAAIERVERLSDHVSASVAERRFASVVLVTFAVLALALASTGLYGVLAYAVSQRRREFGLRAALGASRAGLIALVLREGLGVTAIGLAIGLAGAAALTRLMQSALFGVTPLDAVSFAAAPAALAIVAVAACLMPAVRAASIDPAETLRSE
jgi:putative ABC transport system permease protein